MKFSGIVTRIYQSATFSGSLFGLVHLKFGFKSRPIVKEVRMLGFATLIDLCFNGFSGGKKS